MLLPKDTEQEIDMVETTFIAQVILKHLSNPLLMQI